MSCYPLASHLIMEPALHRQSNLTHIGLPIHLGWNSRYSTREMHTLGSNLSGHEISSYPYYIWWRWGHSKSWKFCQGNMNYNRENTHYIYIYMTTIDGTQHVHPSSVFLMDHRNTSHQIFCHQVKRFPVDRTLPVYWTEYKYQLFNQ